MPAGGGAFVPGRRPSAGEASLGALSCSHMNDSPPQSRSRSFGRTVVAALVFLVAAWVLLGLVIHVVSAAFSTVLLILAVVAVVWALKVLL